jgi:hypothetical protein
MTRTIRWIPLVALLLSGGLLGALEYLPWREKDPLRFHMDRPSSDEIVQKRTPVELRVENTSKYPVVYYGGSIFLANKPVAYFCQLKGSLGNGVVIQPGGTYAHQKEMPGQVLGTVRDAKTEMRYSWAPVREAWFAKTLLPAIKNRLPSKWSSAIPEIQKRREVAPVEVTQIANGEAS